MKTTLRFLKLFLLFCLTLSGIMTNTALKAQVKIGVFADCQYCNCETQGKRFYRNSLLKLEDCIKVFNSEKLEFVVGLGDLIDKDFESFEAVNSVLQESNTQVYHVTGNHDYSVDEKYLKQVPKALNLKETYYAVGKDKWQFIFLNGNEISIHSGKPKNVETAKQMLKKLSNENQANNQEWNGGIGKQQIIWLTEQLKSAQRENKNVVLFCHYPIFPLEIHALWEAREVKTLLEEYTCVKAWVNGHNHAGDYKIENGIHYLTLQGMVDTEKDNAFAIFTFHTNKIVVDGFEREPKRVLQIK